MATVAGPLDVDAGRPSVAWVSSLPPAWTTTAERLVLYVLALDAYEHVSAPTWEHLRQWTGMWQDAVGKAIRGLETPTSKRPALIQRQDRDGNPMAPGQRSGGRNRTRYRLMVEIEPNGNGRPVSDLIEPDGNIRPIGTPQPDGTTGRNNRTEKPNGDSRPTPFPALPPNSSPKVTRDCVGDDDGLRPIRELTPWRELAKAGGER